MLPDKELLTDNSLHTTEQNPKKSLIEIREYMNQCYNEPLSIRQLAEMADISPKYFGDLFKRTFGMSAMNYLTYIRINHAKRYLTESDELLRDIALKVGYSDEFYFSRIFKKEVGVPPSDYNKHKRQRIATCSSSVTGQLIALNIVPMSAPLDPKWTDYYYNAYSTKIKSHLDLSDPYITKKFEANLRKLAQDRPDVIIGTDQFCPEDRDQLMAIAPSFFVPTKHVGWRDQLRMIAQFLDREDSAKLWIEQYDHKVLAAKDHIGQVLGSDRTIVLRIYGPNIYMYWNRGLEDVLYQDLNLEILNRLEVSSNIVVTIEELAVLNPERILLVVCPEASSRTYWLALQHSIEWIQLTAVRNRHVYYILSDPWFEYSAVAIIRMLDEALLLFTGKCPNSFQDYVHGEFDRI
ncbi:helix-turn-helix domain-containing protein [Paenibacillus macquariensis]|uniref:ABC-type Fe3+-hydroxamate transport system, substrate-binding protein n=1 Tax=Paenibacillus macquariensis TaxID=948756 RepID=A0ABY1JMP8_9BACL|nr:helix-turn-helix domain-containing protein [Paenibacillus macquariensis]MEC0092279.1 helix-turn-helix domain-containing protein [Paenibacillus macquariensis]OAB37177.1 AraC family transcriptional regulator [Paenibacillus macquariensis subsp. macquariensis]SIQ47143.1 ABC-type Fe3+-hydroxamate transport system, substrate-binding protein [Paenibacillus macquariensis]